MPHWLDVAVDILNRLNSYTTAIEPARQTYEEVTVDTKPVDSRSKNFLTIQQFDAIEYDSSHLWICAIEGAPGHFSKWIPAQELTEPSKALTVSAMSFGIEEVNTLNGYNAQTLRMDLIDDEYATLENWLIDWQKNTSYREPSTGFYYAGFKYLADILKTIKVTKYTWQKDKLYTNAYSVIPTGEIVVTRTNDPAIKILNVTFSVFGSSKIKNTIPSSQTPIPITNYSTEVDNGYSKLKYLP